MKKHELLKAEQILKGKAAEVQKELSVCVQNLNTAEVITLQGAAQDIVRQGTMLFFEAFTSLI